MIKIIKFSFVLFVLSNAGLFGQDTIVLKNNSKLLVRIAEVGKNEVKYSSFIDNTSPVLSIERSEVNYLAYADGYRQKMDINDSIYANTKDLFFEGQADAEHFYKGYKAASTATLVISLLSPLVGLIPAIGCSTTVPQESNLQYPSSELYHKLDYQRGYTIQAKRIKSRTVWRNWGIAFGVNVMLIMMLPTQQ